MASVLRPWVEELNLREQGALLVALRGCDLAPKPEAVSCSTGETSTERQLTAYLRFLVMVPFDYRELGLPGGFFRTAPPEPGWKPWSMGHYPMHWVLHIVHAFEIVSFRYPDIVVRTEARRIYLKFVESFHLVPEPEAEMTARYAEDRIGT